MTACLQACELALYDIFCQGSNSQNKKTWPLFPLASSSCVLQKAWSVTCLSCIVVKALACHWHYQPLKTACHSLSSPAVKSCISRSRVHIVCKSFTCLGERAKNWLAVFASWILNWSEDAAQSTQVHAGVVPALTHLFQLSTHSLISQRVESGVFEQEKQYAVEVFQKTPRKAKQDGWRDF